MANLVGQKAITSGRNHDMNPKFIVSVTLAATALFQSLPAYGQKGIALELTAPKAAQLTATPALWVVKDDDTTIYLFGTFHFLPNGLNWNNGPVKSAFDSADSLKLEIANLAADTPAIRAIMTEQGQLPPGQSLFDGLGDRQARELKRIISEAGLAPDSITKLRPWLASIILSVSLYQKLGLNPRSGADQTLDDLARARGISVEGFETGAEQMLFFASRPRDQQRAMLLSTLREWDESKSMLDQMLAAWSRGDARKIGTMMSDGLRSQPELAAILLTDRNRVWADWVGGRMAQPGIIFVAVGAGHLAGRDSVQAFLTKKGLMVKRVPNPASNQPIAHQGR
jgi:uncharacterized protein